MKNFDWRGLLRYEGGSVLMIASGALLAIKPDLASGLVSAVLGWLLIAAGVAMLVNGFVGGVKTGSVVSGAVLLIAGSFLHKHPLMIASVLGFLLGALAVSQGWQAAKRVQRTKVRGGFWIPGAVIAALELLVGLRLILSPLSVSRVLLRMVGIVMILCGGLSVASDRFAGYIPDHDGIIDADE